MTFRTRFAPSPTGPLHLGHAYSAILAHDMARVEGGAFLLRIEDIDRDRSKPEWEAQIHDDLRWLGLSWETPVLRQSERQAEYRKVLASLWNRQWLYACSCNRRDILEAVSAPQEGVTYGPDGIVYPGTCRKRHSDRTHLPLDTALRLRIDGFPRRDPRFNHRITGKDGGVDLAHFIETGRGPQGQTGLIEFDIHALPREVGDIVVARKDFGTSYHLSVVLDDADQGITHVVRGQDLFEATKIHVILQKILNLPTPIYHHHRLIRDETGKRLAKRDDARAISKYRADGASPADIRAMVGL